MWLSELKKRHTLFYAPYPPLADVSSTGGSAQIARIEKFLYEKQWSPAHNASLNLIQQSLLGLHYLQTYDRFLIKSIVTAAYTGWMAFASLYVFRPGDNNHTSYVARPPLASTATILSGVVLLTFWALFVVQKSPFMFYVYIAFPCYFWQQFLVHITPVIGFKFQTKNMQGRYLQTLSTGGITIASLLGMVVCLPLLRNLSFSF